MKIKTFRGMMLDSSPGNRKTIRLATKDGLTGYKIRKFQIIPNNFGSQIDANIQIYTEESAANPSSTIDFNDPLLLGVAAYYNGTYEIDETVVFDNVKFNQDIYLAYNESLGSEPCNYYLELEQVKLSLDEATVATLKDMRGSE
jgi:hypothetical protein